MSARPSGATRVTRGSARRRILDAAIDVIRRQGLSATTVDDLCAAAGVTKGAFFHHFPSKEALAIAAAQHWSEVTGEFFASAGYHDRGTAAERVLAYIDLRGSLVQGRAVADFTCLAGTMAQETFDTQPAVRDACGVSILGHAATLEADLREALAESGHGDIDSAGLARHVQAVLQGSFVLAKAADDPELVLDSLAHLRRYLHMLLRTASDSQPHPHPPGGPLS